MEWIRTFRVWVILLTLSITAYVVSPAAGVMLSLFQMATLLTLGSRNARPTMGLMATYMVLSSILMALAVFPVIWVIVLMGFVTMILSAVLDTEIHDVLGIVSSVSVFFAVVTVNSDQQRVFHPTALDGLVVLGSIIAAVALEKYVPVRIYENGISIGDPRKGRLYSRYEHVQWSDKWPRLAEVLEEPPKYYDLDPAVTNGKKWCRVNSRCNIQSNQVIDMIKYSSGTITFLTVLENNIVRVVQRSPDISWISRTGEPPADASTEKVLDLKDFKYDSVVVEKNKVRLMDSSEGTEFIYDDDEKSVTLIFHGNSKEKITVTAEEWEQELTYEEIKDFTFF